jgi:hypothetical protein
MPDHGNAGHLVESGTKMSNPKMKSGDEEKRGGLIDEHVKAVANAVNYSRSLREQERRRGEPSLHLVRDSKEGSELMLLSLLFVKGKA